MVLSAHQGLAVTSHHGTLGTGHFFRWALLCSTSLRGRPLCSVFKIFKFELFLSSVLICLNKD